MPTYIYPPRLRRAAMQRSYSRYHETREIAPGYNYSTYAPCLWRSRPLHAIDLNNLIYLIIYAEFNSLQTTPTLCNTTLVLYRTVRDPGNSPSQRLLDSSTACQVNRQHGFYDTSFITQIAPPHPTPKTVDYHTIRRACGCKAHYTERRHCPLRADGLLRMFETPMS